ncbi:MAG TPA: hypothetical protein VMT74_05660 [Gaiellaceae bacterium]|nr:hypothetical protein [Gaiellaceae bacterium]
MTSFSLPWYVIAGAEKGVIVELPVFGAALLAVVGQQRELRDLGLLVENEK